MKAAQTRYMPLKGGLTKGHRAVHRKLLTLKGKDSSEFRPGSGSRSDRNMDESGPRAQERLPLASF